MEELWLADEAAPALPPPEPDELTALAALCELCELSDPDDFDETAPALARDAAVEAAGAPPPSEAPGALALSDLPAEDGRIEAALEVLCRAEDGLLRKKAAWALSRRRAPRQSFSCPHCDKILRWSACRQALRKTRRGSWFLATVGA